MKKLVSQLPHVDLQRQRVFLRADLNVPLINGTITNDYRCTAIQPTVDLILKKGGTIVLATHLGRPQGFDESLSSKHLIPWFETHGYHIHFEPNLDKAITRSKELKKEIIILENMRFFEGEKNQEKAFAQLLASTADYYVNDAFALLHRNDTSITLLPQLFDVSKKTIGLLIEKELKELNKLLNSPQQPFLFIVGGGKVHDKLPLLFNLLSSVNIILLCPAIVFTFSKALGKEVGKSLIDAAQTQACKDFLNKAHKQGVTIVFPEDYQVAYNDFYGALSYTTSDQIPSESVGISIGPKTEKLFESYISKAKTIFFNGLLGDDERPETLGGSQAIFKAMAASPAYTVIGGGDSVGVVQSLGLDKQIDYLSTGGGATLAYLAGQNLPGLNFITQ